MTKDECTAFALMVESKLGNPKMTWEGPEPHDFRDMKARGVRFVNSELFFKTADFDLGGPAFQEVSDYAPDGNMYFKILAGDEAAADEISARIVAAGWAYVSKPWAGTPDGCVLSFTVPVVNSAT